MQALSMIDTGMSMTEPMVSTKQVESKGNTFGQVMKEQRPTEAPKHRQKEASQKVDAKPHAADQKAQPTQQVESQNVENAAAAETDQAIAVVELQKTVVQLVQVIAGDSSPELTEEFGTVEELLNQLVQQLDSSDLEGEQVLAGIDLSALTEQLQVLSEDGGENPLAQLASQLEIQLEEEMPSEQEQSGAVDLAAAMMAVDSSKVDTPKIVENLSEARQILQKVINAVAADPKAVASTSGEVVEVAAEMTSEEFLSSEVVEEIDPRFAGLLKPRTETIQQQMSRQSVNQTKGAQQGNTAVTPQNVSVTDQPVNEATSEQGDADFAELLQQTPKQGLDALTRQVQGAFQPTASQVQNVANRVMPEVPTVQLPSGQQVAESQIFDQVVTHISGSQNGESGRMVLRLQPAELGSLKLELMVEGDRVRANLHAQTQQVQEVLERNLPQLRNALAEQGLKIDQFQVNIDQRQQNGQFDNLSQQDQSQQSPQEDEWSQVMEEDQAIPLAHLMQTGGGGISLRV